MIREMALIAGLAYTPAAAVECNEIIHDGTTFTVCEVDATSQDIRLFLNDASGAPYGQFSAVERDLALEGMALQFAMNGGMYHEDRTPVGYFVEAGEELMRVIDSPGPGNFGLVPNGIFCIRDNRADVIETLNFLRDAPACNYATQSGPMLVIDGELHPRFLEDGTSTFIRNGVGTSAEGSRAVFAISQTQVNFYSFGTLFRDTLALPNALFLDGNISRLYAPQIDRDDFGRRMGPIVGVISTLD